MEKKPKMSGELSAEMAEKFVDHFNWFIEREGISLAEGWVLLRVADDFLKRQTGSQGPNYRWEGEQ